MSELNEQYRDKLNLKGNCPGFNLWEVTATDGNKYLMASDHASGASTRLYFATNGKVDVKESKLIGPNPDAETWKAARF